MRPLMLIIATSAAVLALPRPLPVAQDLADTILGSVGGILGNSDRHNSKCHHRNKEDLSTCIHQCVDDFCSVAEPTGCNSCIRGCTSRRVCDGGDSRANGRPVRQGTTRTQAMEESE
ncbi:hypothetical protein F4776DRAFT_190648 [Hypoxylon sp. NC0597]|nr:hypothetical protein F4776DRAFT_190648 [Hypoxylon sp. NC0597]